MAPVSDWAWEDLSEEEFPPLVQCRLQVPSTRSTLCAWSLRRAWIYCWPSFDSTTSYLERSLLFLSGTNHEVLDLGAVFSSCSVGFCHL